MNGARERPGTKAMAYAEDGRVKIVVGTPSADLCLQLDFSLAATLLLSNELCAAAREAMVQQGMTPPPFPREPAAAVPVPAAARRDNVVAFLRAAARQSGEGAA